MSFKGHALGVQCACLGLHARVCEKADRRLGARQGGCAQGSERAGTGRSLLQGARTGTCDSPSCTRLRGAHAHVTNATYQAGVLVGRRDTVGGSDVPGSKLPAVSPAQVGGGVLPTGPTLFSPVRCRAANQGWPYRPTVGAAIDSVGGVLVVTPWGDMLPGCGGRRLGAVLTTSQCTMPSPRCPGLSLQPPGQSLPGTPVSPRRRSENPCWRLGCGLR